MAALLPQQLERMGPAGQLRNTCDFEGAYYRLAIRLGPEPVALIGIFVPMVTW
jgi:hypothetical protein